MGYLKLYLTCITLALGSAHVFISCLKVERFGAFLMSSGRLFQILGPNALKESVPYFFVFCDFTKSLFRLWSRLVLRVKTYLIEMRFKSLMVLKISLARILICLISIVILSAIFKRWS